MTEQPLPPFPADFRWGVATSAYQIEGAATADGRGVSIWDTFAHTPGRIADASTGDVACDHYHRYAEDVALMADLGVSAYRFSVAWTRIQPDGTGPANPAGLAFYDRLVDALLERDIDPVATLYHWDLPQALQETGGWLDRDTAGRFADYADLVAARLGDRVRLWITLNEPFIHLSHGYALGLHAPGETRLFAALPAAHHLLLGHGLALAALRARSGAPVAITNNYTPVRAASDDEADQIATATYDALHNRLFTDPVFGLGYPPGVPIPDGTIHPGDAEVIATPIDTLGVNYYNPTVVRAADPAEPLPFVAEPPDGYPVTAFGWPVAPDGLYDLLTELRARYGAALPPIQITENGCAYDDVPTPNGGCPDPARIAYHDGHLRALRRAMADGVDVRGYFVWSLLDNFEWAEGFTKRFGLVHVDFATGQRTPKSSYAWYRDVIARSKR
jgi:beta-glucosidase